MAPRGCSGVIAQFLIYYSTQPQGDTTMTKAEFIDRMFRDIINWDVDEGEGEGDDFILSGRGWNLYKDGERKYRLYDCEYGEEYEIDNPEDIDALERHLNN